MAQHPPDDATNLLFRRAWNADPARRWIITPDGTVCDRNLAAAAPTEGDHPLWESAPWRSNSGTGERLRAECDVALRTGRTVYRESMQVDGATASFEIEINRFDERPDPHLSIALRAVSHDVAEDRAAREIAALDVVAQVAARIAHEINNPLAGIQNSFLLLRSAIPESHPHFAFVAAIEREIARIARVTRALYDTYRPARDATPDSAVATVIGDALRTVRHQRHDEPVRLRLDVAANIGVVPLPSVLVRQVIYNLVQHAADTVGAGVEITLRARRDGDALCLAVRAAGLVPAAGQSSIIPVTAGRADQRRPLALTLLHRAVHALDGRVEYSNPDHDASAEIEVFLPLR